MRFQVHHVHEKGWDQTLLKDAETGTYASIIPSAGGILNGFGTRLDDRETEVIDGFRDPDDWQANKEKGFKSAKLSPFVCRIRDAVYDWQGQRYRLQKFSLNGAAIHGLIYNAPFSIIEEAAQHHFAEVELKYTYTGSDPGYPFAYDCYIKYRLEELNRLTIVTAIHNRSKIPIPVADGWHPYFTLGKPIDNLQLQVRSLSMLEYDAALIPTSGLVPCADWLEPTLIGNTRLDNGYLLDFTMTQPLCTLSDPETGLGVEVYPDFSYPYLQLYTPDHRQSIAIENLSAAPDAFNNKIGLIVLDPDHTKTFTTRYRITTTSEDEE